MATSLDSSSSDDEDGRVRSANAASDAKPCIQRLRETPIRRVLTYLRVTNMLNALLVILVFPLGFVTEALTLQVSTAFFTGYSVIFAVVLFIFECNCGAGCGGWHVAVRTNFGFLYSFVGRTAFLLFVSSICLCAQTASGYIMSALTFLNAAANCVVLAAHPAFGKGGQLSPFDDPTKVAESLKDVGVELASKNPSLVAKVVKAATPSPEGAFSIIAKQVVAHGASAEV